MIRTKGKICNYSNRFLSGQVAKVIEEMATQATALASRAHLAKKELKRVQAQLADAKQAQQEVEEKVKKMAH